jgi:hypothetical protein
MVFGGSMSKKKLTVSSIAILDLARTNKHLVELVKQQQSELDMQGFRIQGFLDYLKKHCKEKKVRKDLH